MAYSANVRMEFRPHGGESIPVRRLCDSRMTLAVPLPQGKHDGILTVQVDDNRHVTEVVAIVDATGERSTRYVAKQGAMDADTDLP